MQRARTVEAKDERREALLGAALDAFFDKGFAAARMEDIARRAGVSKGTLYLYFNSKDALFSGLIDIVAKPKLEQLQFIAQSAPNLHPMSPMPFAP